MMRIRPAVLAMALLLALASTAARAHAQDRAALLAFASAAASADTVVDSPRPFRLLRVAKWTVLAGSAGAGVWGFLQNERADEKYRELEQQCEAEPARCRRRLSDGAYEDAVFETRYQEIRALDRDSHAALLAGQLGLAASVALFLLDLGNIRPPADIPYDPRLSATPDRVVLEIRLFSGR
jgi:hypothetical protein